MSGAQAIKKLEGPISPLWAVSVYGQNSRLLRDLALPPGWPFLLGCGAGLLLSVMYCGISRCSHPPGTVPIATSREIPAWQID
ncbi:MAG: hypothetical protein AAF282_05005 [Cyanobacteria bacterium P01_A01_bin.15]